MTHNPVFGGARNAHVPVPAVHCAFCAPAARVFGQILPSGAGSKYSELFPGNQSEPATLALMVEKMEMNLSEISDKTIVMDAGIPTKGKDSSDPTLRAVSIKWAKKDDLKPRNEGSYVLRTDRLDLCDEKIWNIYIMLGNIEYSYEDFNIFSG